MSIIFTINTATLSEEDAQALSNFLLEVPKRGHSAKTSKKENLPAPKAVPANTLIIPPVPVPPGQDYAKVVLSITEYLQKEIITGEQVKQLLAEAGVKNNIMELQSDPEGLRILQTKLDELVEVPV